MLSFLPSIVRVGCCNVGLLRLCFPTVCAPVSHGLLTTAVFFTWIGLSETTPIQQACKCSDIMKEMSNKKFEKLNVNLYVEKKGIGVSFFCCCYGDFLLLMYLGFRGKLKGLFVTLVDYFVIV